MDIPRKKSGTRNRRLRKVFYAVVALVTIALITYGVSRLKPAAPGVERATLLIDTVKRGPMIRQVRGTGTLVPENIRVIAASTQGRVERIQVATRVREDADAHSGGRHRATSGTIR